MRSLKQSYVEALIKQRIRISVFVEEMENLGVYVVQPGEVVPMIYYQNEIRYFPELDEEDYVIGGHFG